MTGYGRDVVHVDHTTITVEIRSVNHRFLDFNTKIPPSFLFIEDKIKKIVQSFFNRGRIEVYIGVEGNGFVKRSLQTDWDLMDQYMDQVQKAIERYQLAGEIPTSIITTIPDLFSIQQTDQQLDKHAEAVLKAIEVACSEVHTMRVEEGSNLQYDIIERMKAIQEMIPLIQSRRKDVINEYHGRIHDRIREHLGDNFLIDDSRLVQEIAILAEKGDITEEITRLFSHVDYFLEIIQKEEPIGRKLDFILQEMHRETNTIGSKSTDTRIGEWVVSLKSDIEKIKEQIQNIE